MKFYQKQIDPSTGEQTINNLNARKIGITIPERIYMKGILSNENWQGFRITITFSNEEEKVFYIGKTFIYETEDRYEIQDQNIIQQTGQIIYGPQISEITFPQIHADWAEEDYINNNLRYILVDYVR